MARKSRKNNKEIVKDKNICNRYNVGAYVRLSRIDNVKENNDSIQNQKNIILDYIKQNSEFNLFNIYEDTNFSGTNFNRDGFEMLIDDVKKGKINCIIVKDLSRFGRNYVECGNYLEKIFPFMNVRFIAINDNYDSIKEDSNDILLMHLKNIINDMYAKDISKKIQTALNQKRKDGLFIGAWASYGYLKDTNNKNKLIINEETACIVKHIFNLRLQGFSYSKIAITLNEKNILSPYAYLYKIGVLKNEKYKDKKWNVTNIKSILSNQVYIGNIVQGKKKTDLLTGKKYETVKSDDWIIVYGTHKPIISEDTFYKVQEINKKAKDKYESNNKCKTKKTTDNIFKGIIVCGCCNKKLNRKEEIKLNKNKSYRFFYCNGRKIKQCNFTTINEDVIKQVVFEQIKNEIMLINQFKSIIKQNNSIINLEAENLKLMINDINLEIEKINIYNKNAYEDYLLGVLSEDDYLFIKNNYLEKIKILIQNKENLEHKLHDLENNFLKNNCFNELSTINIDVLTKELVQAFIDKIVVYEDKTIQINFKYKNEYFKKYYQLERILKNVV